MDPCDTPAFTDNHSDVWLFNATLGNLLSKKLSISSRHWKCPMI